MITIEKIDQIEMLQKLRISKSAKLKITPINGMWQIQLVHEKSNKLFVLIDPKYKIKTWVDSARALNYVVKKLNISINNLIIERGK